uniref:Uncharacterized protein n=1 Tax=Octopus bimaculoides TaxID=37653 RepID=A0A0L8GDX0_OCTBM
MSEEGSSFIQPNNYLKKYYWSKEVTNSARVSLNGERKGLGRLSRSTNIGFNRFSEILPKKQTLKKKKSTNTKINKAFFLQ